MDGRVQITKALPITSEEKCLRKSKRKVHKMQNQWLLSIERCKARKILRSREQVKKLGYFLYQTVMPKLLFNPNLGELFRVLFEIGDKITPLSNTCSNYPRNMEFGTKVHHTYAISENIPFSTKALLLLLMATLFCKKSAFLTKIVPFLKAIV